MENKNSLNHIAVIIDGNRRYAQARGMPAFIGHEKGAEKVEKFLDWARELNIKETTIYALSIENLNRDEEEVSHLFRIFGKFFEGSRIKKKIDENKVKVRFIGDLSLIPKDVKELAEKIENRTKNYDKYKVNFCFSYGGRQEIISAFNKLLKTGKKSVTESDITNALWLSDEPQLIIRTGGKSRSSNFLPWQSVYSEWLFLDKMWPEIEKEDLIECVERFNKVQRNFGK